MIDTSINPKSLGFHLLDVQTKQIDIIILGLGNLTFRLIFVCVVIYQPEQKGIRK